MMLVLPLIFFFLLVLVDFGIALDRREVLQHAVREGVRHAVVEGDIDEVKDYTVAQSQVDCGTGPDEVDCLTADDIEVCYLNMDGNTRSGDVGDNVRVKANFTYRFSMGGGEIASALGVDSALFNIDMNPSADMALEKSVAGLPECAP